MGAAGQCPETPTICFVTSPASDPDRGTSTPWQPATSNPGELYTVEGQIRSVGAFVNTEVLARARAAGCTIREVPVRHFPRTVGEQTGARPRVILRAFAELVRLYGELRTASAPEPAPSAEALPRLS